MSDDAELFSALLPGRDRRIAESPRTELQVAIDEVTLAVRGLPELPTVFFGHSMGAEIAYEVTRQLEQSGCCSVRHVIVSGAEPKCSPGRLITDRYKLPKVKLIEELMSIGGVPAALAGEPELVERFLPPLQADLQAIETWSPARPRVIRADLTVLCGKSDVYSERALRAWEALSLGHFELQMFPGGHFYLSEQKRAVLHLVNSALGELRIGPAKQGSA